jgi:plastocyanin domain-containing protein
MDLTETLVVVGAGAAIVLVLWYFFGGREAAATVSAAGVQEVKITVRGGYSPDVVVVKRGVPVRIAFYRDETSSCSEQVVFAEFGIARDLPAFESTTIEITPMQAGEFTFTCGKNLMHGKLIVES